MVCFDPHCNREFMRDQCQEIQKHKWIESEKKGYDLGVMAELEWVRQFARDYRDWWFASRGY